MTNLHLVVLAVIQTKNCFPPESLLLIELRLRPCNRHQIRNEVILVPTGSTSTHDFWRPNANLEIHLNEHILPLLFPTVCGHSFLIRAAQSLFQTHSWQCHVPPIDSCPSQLQSMLLSLNIVFITSDPTRVLIKFHHFRFLGMNTSRLTLFTSDTSIRSLCISAICTFIRRGDFNHLGARTILA